MEELFELKKHIEQGNYAEALTVIAEMEEMSRDDKISKIFSYIEILLIHLIRQHSENRSTRSWEASIRNLIYKINYINKRRKVGGYYLSEKELEEIIADAWKVAVVSASLEAFEGRYDDAELARKIDPDRIRKEALKLLADAR
ncbi:MAG: hypothetical protein BWK80_62915 [Desulfobacteraceae bacterium IS3]|nr:MAG: hypothetical protein BWK80_62915 [Desulfobacteraceae bacterium IS3]